MFRTHSKNLDFNEFFQIAIAKVNQLTNLNGNEEALLVEFGEALVNAFERTGKQEFFKQAFVAPYVSRASRQKAILDNYTELENKINEDSKMTDEQKQKQIYEMNLLRDKELQHMLQSD